MRPGPGGRTLKTGPDAHKSGVPTDPSPIAAPPTPSSPPRPPLPICDEALAPLTALRQGLVTPGAAVPDPAPIVALVREIDRRLGRSDADVIATALATGTDDAGRVQVLGRIDGSILAWLRAALKTAGESSEAAERASAWATAECLFGLIAPTLSPALGDEDLGDGIARNFARGRDALDGPADAQARVLYPAYEAIEKRIFTAIHRVLLADVSAAKGGDPLALVRARGLFPLLRDRLQDRNTPGIAILEAALAGPPAALDPAVFTREFGVAFAKRARKYCSEVVTDEALRGTPKGLASVTEGMTYTRLLLPDMHARVGAKGFDGATYMANWESLLQAVDHGEDADELRRLSDDLVHWNCAYQEALGIAECTSTHDEAAAKPAKPTKR
ncbi:MAG: hypothetical protein R3B09_01235 [Nannocystaceae bacterium]